MTTPSTRNEEQLRAAQNVASRAAFTLARDTGAQIVRRPMFHGAHTTVPDVEPLAGMRSARQLELGAWHTARSYIRDARESGNSWHDIGTALGLTPGGDPQQAGETVAEAAFTYAAGNPDTDEARRYGRSVTWTCRTCDKAISDHGLVNGPADDEEGHARGCQRLAAAVAAWDAQAEAFDAEWEAGR